MGRMTAPAIMAIKALVAESYKVPVCVLDSRCRARGSSRPRQAAMWICRQTTSASTPEIAKQFGRRDHTTVLHACRAVEGRLAKGEESIATLDALESVKAQQPASGLHRGLEQSRAVRLQAEVAALRADVRRLERQLERFRQREAQRHPRMAVPAELKNPDPRPIGVRFDD